jgi:starvation-inducible DNA-binding protein
VDVLAERIQTLGGVLSRLLDAHERILIHAHVGAARAAETGDDGTNDMLVSQVVRTGELQAWFLSEHLVDTPLVRA